MKKTFLISIVFCILFSVSIYSEKPDTVTITHSLDYRPFIFLDEDGNSKGLIIDYWRKWSEKTGITVKFLPYDFSTCIEKVKNREADIIGGIYYSDKRDDFLDFSEPFYGIETSIFIWEKLYITKIEELEGIQVAVVKGDYAEAYAEENLPFLNLKKYALYEDVVKDAVNGKISCFILDKPPALYYLARYDALEKFRDFKELYTMYLRGGVSEGNSDLVQYINKGISSITEDEIKFLEKKWHVYTKKEIPGWVFELFFTILIVLIILSLLINSVYLKKQVNKKTVSLKSALEELKKKNSELTKEIKVRKAAEKGKEELIVELKNALQEVKTLSGLLPMCSHCKKIRDDDGYWQKVEDYLGEYSDAKLSHSLCPSCAKELYPEYFKDRNFDEESSSDKDK